MFRFPPLWNGGHQVPVLAPKTAIAFDGRCGNGRAAGRSWRSRCRRIVNDPPIIIDMAKQKRETAVRRIIGAPEAPSAVGNCQIWTNGLDIEVGKRQRAHLLARMVPL